MAGSGGTTDVTGTAVDAAIPVPSGQDVRFLDLIRSEPGPDGLTLRFRFIAPAIARTTGTIDAEAAQTDMLALCNDYALPRLPTPGPAPSQIIIVLSDREVPFGETAPDVTQYFEAYSFLDGACIWEPF
jgi:hypothetical protein